MHSRKISVCTVAMNRVAHLSNTLIKNIAENEHEEGVEFVVLNYGSQDNMHDWIMEHCRAWMRSGLLRYYHFPEAREFKMSHAKNMVAKLANHEIVCLVDADNYIGKGYISYVRSLFTSDQSCFATTIAEGRQVNSRDTYGRVCFYQEDFHRVRGFDEAMAGYGFEDFDFITRLQRSGLQRRLMDKPEYLRYINHNNTDRIENQRNYKNLDRILVRYLSHCQTEVFILFKDQNALSGIMVNKQTEFVNRLSHATIPYLDVDNMELRDGRWFRGKWTMSDQGVPVFFRKSGSKTLAFDDYDSLTDRFEINRVLFYQTVLENYGIMKNNGNVPYDAVNTSGYGIGTIHQIFCHE